MSAVVQLCVTSPQDLILEDAVLDHKLTPQTSHELSIPHP